jgi:glycosyltransferase involved in cell wall biosynthesis
VITVILAVYNGAGELGEQLESLANQNYDQPWELIVADNGSTDGSAGVAAAWSDRIPGLRVLDASSVKGSAAARNLAASQARGTKLAFCDHDDVVQPGWVAAMSAALDQHDLVAGHNDFGSLNQPAGTRSTKPARDFYQFLPYGLGCNLGVSRRAFEAVQGFEASMRANYDLDLCWRVQLAGYPLHVEPAAVVAKRHRGSSGDIWRQHFTYGVDDLTLYRRFCGHGMPRRLDRAARRYAWLVLHLPDLRRPPGRRSWTRVAANQAGRLVGSVRQRTVYL